MNIGEKITAAMRYANLNQPEAVSAVKKIKGGERFTQQSLSKLLKVTTDTHQSSYLPHIAIACGVRAEWMVADSGPMTSGQTDIQEPSQVNEEREVYITNKYQRLIEDLESLPPGVAEQIHKLVTSMRATMVDDFNRKVEKAAEIILSKTSSGTGPQKQKNHN